MKRALHRRIEWLESRSDLQGMQPDSQPLRILSQLVSPEYRLAPGERIVEDDVLEGPYQRFPLMLTVHERITSDPNDHGILWSSRRIANP